MRTKSILLAAATIAAGALSSQAQSNVYSVNVVGYINVTIQPGYNLITAPLQATNNNVNTVLANANPVFPGGGLLFTWGGSGYNQALQAGGDGFWYDANFNLATNQVPPGKSFFVQNASGSPLTLTLTGTVIQGTNVYPQKSGFEFFGDPEPIVGDITTNGFPVQDNALLYTWNTGTQGYNQALTGVGPGSGGPLFVDNNFNPVVVAPALGTGFIYFNPAASNNWTRSFVVQ